MSDEEKTMMLERYKIDVRAGCCAVIDTTTIDRERQGLSSDMEGVIKLWMFPQYEKKCRACGHCKSEFSDGVDQIKQATELCEQLNKEPRQ